MLIKEDFLFYIWKHKLLLINKLETTAGHKLRIINTGELNHNAGPDFFNARISIDNQIWAGNIEIHTHSSDWYVHHHEKNPAYDNVILHVVWLHDAEIFRDSRERIPTLEIRKYIDENLLINYQQLYLKPAQFVSCEQQIRLINKFTLDNWLERLYVERLMKRSEMINKILKETKNDWEAVLFRLLARNFGLKVNGDAFAALAESFDFKILRAQQHDLTRLEALLFGQAGFLEGDSDQEYFKKLSVEYKLLQIKYHLEPVENTQFMFFRLRPVNFPTIRIAQLAKLYFIHKNLFSSILEIRLLDDFYKLLSTDTSDFWQEHYSFVSVSKRITKKLSRSFIDLLLINTVFPLIFQNHQQKGIPDKTGIFGFMEAIKPEKNHIIDKFSTLGIAPENALRTQALLQMKNEYCNKNLCMECSIGHYLMRSGT